MSAEDLDNYETDAELTLYKEYRDVIKLFTYVVETERRFYLANKVDFNVRSAGQDVYFDVQLTDAWVWDVYRSSRFVKNVRIVTFKDVNVEEVQKSDIDIPDDMNCRPTAVGRPPSFAGAVCAPNRHVAVSRSRFRCDTRLLVYGDGRFL